MRDPAASREIATLRAIVARIADLRAADEGYGQALDLIGKAVGAEGGAFLYLDGFRLPRFVRTGLAGSQPADRPTHRAFEAAVDVGRGALSLLGFSWGDHAGKRFLAPKDESIGVLLLGRSDRDFLPAELAFLDDIMAIIGPLVEGRAYALREMRIRTEVEKSLHHSEDSLRTFFAESRDMIYTANADDCIASINAAGLAFLGCTDRFEAVGHPFRDFALNREDRDFFLERIRRDGFVDDYEIIFKRPDGSELFCVENARAVRGTDGTVTAVQGIVRDISERIRNEREVWQANLELVEANIAIKDTQLLVIQQEKLASIGYLASGIAHEINNPLGFLRSNHEFLAGFFGTIRKAWSSLQEAHPEELAAIARELDLDYLFTETGTLLSESDAGYRRIMEIVKSLKDYARAGVDRQVSAYDLNKGLESTLVVAWNKIKYVADVEKDYGQLPFIEADGGSINQVLLNILVNAAEAIESQHREGKGLITIRTRLEGGTVECLIGDDGPGVPEKMRLRVFDPFFTTKEPGKGTGLGLSISYDIVVSRHGGSLTVGQSPSGGALFRMCLPLGPGSGAQDRKPVEN